MITAKNKEILFVEGLEFYVKRKISLPLPGIVRNIKAISAAFPLLHKMTNLFA